VLTWTRAHKGLVATYTIVHGAAEFFTALTLFSMLTLWTNPGWKVFVYSSMAFGLPVFIALGAHRWVLGKITEGQMGLAGAVLMGTGMMVGHFGWACVLLLGLGSAMIHIAAGTATLKLAKPGTAVGVFESTGALGLAAGTVLGSGALSLIGTSPWIGLGALIVVAGGVAVLAWGSDREFPGLAAAGFDTTRHPADRQDPVRSPRSEPQLSLDSKTGLSILALAALAIISVARTLMYFTTEQPWKVTPALILIAASMVLLGRAIGGILTDIVGFVPTAIAGFIGTAVFFALWPSATWAGLIALFCLSATMAPIIVGLLASTRRPALAFGLAQFFQVPAGLTAGIFFSPWIIFATMILCGVLVLGLHPLDQRRSHANLGLQ